MVNERFRRVTQIGIVVKDIEEARAAWAELLAVEKPLVIETERWESTHMAFRGEPSEGRARLAFFNLENIVVELIQPIGGPSTWQEFLEKRDGAVHHIAFNVEDLDDTLGKLRGMGIDVEQRGDYKEGYYVYADSKNKLGTIIELLHSHS